MPTTILSTRFNSLQDRLKAVLGTSLDSAPTFGYGQPLTVEDSVSGTRTTPIPESDKISAQEYENLYIDIIRCRAHQLGSSNVSIDDFLTGNFDVNAENTDKVEELYISNLESLMTQIETDRFKINIADQAVTSSLFDSSGTKISSTYSNSTNGQWTNFINHIFTVTFPTTEDRRHFFNSGGEIRFSANVNYTGSQQKTSNWQSQMAEMGVISFTADDTYSNFDVGQSSNFGNNTLTNSYQLCYRKNAGATYSQSAYELYALNLGPRTIQFKVLFTDPNPGGYSIDEPVFGDWTSSADLLIPEGTININGTQYDTVVISDQQTPVGNNIVSLSATNPPVPSYSLSRSASSVNEGSSVSFTLNTTNVSNGVLIPYTITGVQASDIGVPLEGSFVVGSGDTVTVPIVADATTDGTDTLRISLNNGQASSTVTINDTSLSPPAAGTLLSSACVGFDLVGTYADGSGGSYTQIIETNSLSCGYEPPFTFSVSPSAYLTESTSWDIGEVIVGTTVSTNITLTGTGGSGTVTVQTTSRPLSWAVAVDGSIGENVDANGEATKDFSLSDGQSITVPISVRPDSINDFALVNRNFHFSAVGSNGASYKIYYTGTSIEAPGVPTITTFVNEGTARGQTIGDETTNSTYTYSGTVSNWTSTTGDVYWNTPASTANATADDFVGNITSGSAPVTITNSPDEGDGTFTFTRTVRADQKTEGTETFATQAYWPQINPTTFGPTRFVAIGDTSIDVPVTASFTNPTHTFSLAPGQTETWSTTVTLDSSPNNNPITLTAQIASWYQDWEVRISGSPIAVAGGTTASKTFTLTPGQSENITISVTAKNGPHSASSGQVYLYQGNPPYASGTKILDRLTYTGTTGNWLAPVIKTAGFSPSNAAVNVPTTIYYTTDNATQVQYIITGEAILDGLSQTYDNGFQPDGVNVSANTDQVTFTIEGTANWTIIANTPDGQTDSRTGTVTVTAPDVSVSTNKSVYTEGETITFTLTYNNLTSTSQSYRFYRTTTGSPVSDEYAGSGNGITFSGLTTGTNGPYTATATLTIANDNDIEGDETFKLSDDTAVPIYAIWTVRDKITNSVSISPNPANKSQTFSYTINSAPNSSVTYTVSENPDYADYNPGTTSLTIPSSGTYSGTDRQDQPGTFTYNLSFSQGTPSTISVAQKVCPIILVNRTTSGTILPGDPVGFSITGGLPNGSYTFSRDGAGAAVLSFGATGSAIVNTTAPSTPGTYVYSFTEDFCNTTKTITIEVAQVYSPRGSQTPRPAITDQNVSVVVFGGRPNGSLTVQGTGGDTSTYNGTFNSSGNWIQTGAYGTAGTFPYTITVPDPDIGSTFSVEVVEGTVYNESVTLLQPSPGITLTVYATISGGEPGTRYDFTAVGATPSTGFGSLDANGNKQIQLSSSKAYFSGSINVTFTGGSQGTASDTLTELPNPSISISPANVEIGEIYTVSITGANSNTGFTSTEYGTLYPSGTPWSENGRVTTGLTTSSGGGYSTSGVHTGAIDYYIVANFADGTSATSNTLQVRAAPQATPTYSVNITSPSNNVIPEGGSGTYTVTTTNVSNGTTLYWTISDLLTNSSDFTSRSGSLTINNNSGTFSVGTVADQTTEGQESFTVRIRTGSTSGPIVASKSTTIGDTSTTASGTGTINFDQSSYFVGETLVANYTTTNAATVTAVISRGGTTLTTASGLASGSLAYEALTAGTYGAGLSVNGTVVDTDTVSVTDAPVPPAAPTISFGPSTGIINDTTYTVSWDAKGAGNVSVVVTAPNGDTTTATDDNGTVSSRLGLVGTWTATITSAGGSASASVTVNPAPPAAGTLLSQACVGFNLVGTYADGSGGTYTQTIETNSAACGYNPNPPAGTLISQACQGYDLVGTYADGSGGTYTQTIETNSSSCGWPPAPAAGTLLSQECVGFDLVGTYADGSGGTYTQTIETNSATCGYTPPVTYSINLEIVVYPYNGSTSDIEAIITGGKPNASFGWAVLPGGSGSATTDSSGTATLSASLPAGTYQAAVVQTGAGSSSTSFTVG